MSDATQAPPAVGTFCWNELLTNDPPGARDFYTRLLGWTVQEKDMGPMGTYTVFMQGENMVGGCMQMPPDAGQAPPSWLSYIAVDDLDAMLSKAQSLGGTVCVPATEIPDMGRFGIITDPTGATIALFEGK